MRWTRRAAGLRFLIRSIISTSALWLAAGGPAHAGLPAKPKLRPATAAKAPQASPEARLIEVYRQLRNGDSGQALALAESLAREVPNFQLAQLVYGDLLLVRRGRFEGLGAVPAEMGASAATQWNELRHEAGLRLAALAERPPATAIPRQFIDIPTSTRHVMAVDASRSRLYVFENGAHGLKLVADHYVSLGRFGIDKREQGDQRTPLGVYFITSRLDRQQLKDFYGPGALELNYPNEYDRRRGKTGGGIWLHGVPPQNFSRPPQSTDGCVVLANDDLLPLLRDIAPRRTPVLITPRIEWVEPSQVERDRQAVRSLIEQWRQARSQADTKRLLNFYSAQFQSGGADLSQWARQLEKESQTTRSREVEVKELSVLSWRDTSEVLIVTFGEVRQGERTGPMKRQYWGKEGGQWKIFFEGVIG